MEEKGNHSREISSGALPADGAGAAMVRPAGLLDPTTRRRPFLDQRRPSFRRRWQQRPLWARLLLSLVLALACVLLLLGLAGSPDPSSPPSTDDSSGSADADADADAVSSPLLRQVIIIQPIKP